MMPVPHGTDVVDGVDGERSIPSRGLLPARTECSIFLGQIV